MANNDLKKLAIEFANRVGKSEARRLFAIEGVSPHTADKIICGRYPSEIGVLLGATIRRVLEANKKEAS